MRWMTTLPLVHDFRSCQSSSRSIQKGVLFDGVDRADEAILEPRDYTFSFPMSIGSSQYRSGSAGAVAEVKRGNEAA